MDKLKPEAYWKMVRDEAWTRAWSGANMRYIIPALIFTLTGVSCYGLFALANVVPYPVFKDNVVATLIIQLGQVFIPIAVLVFLAFRGMSSIPPELHNEKVGEINRLQNQIIDDRANAEREIVELKNKLDGLPVQPPFIKCFNYKQTNRLVGISIRNPNPKKITNLQVKLVDLSLIESGQRNPLIEDANFHEFTKGKFTEQNVILRDENVIVYIAEVDLNENLTFYLQNQYQVSAVYPTWLLPPELFSADYEIDLNIIGYVGDHRIEQLFKAAIHRERGRGTWFRDDGNRIETFPATPTSLRIEEITHEQQEIEQENETAR